MIAKHTLNMFNTKSSFQILAIIFMVSCNPAANNSSTAITKNNITLVSKGLTGNDAIVISKNGNMVNLNKPLAATEDVELKLFLTGFTPVNGNVYMQGSMVLLHASNVKDTLLYIPKYFADNYSISNGDARFVQLNVPITQLKKRIDSATIHTTVVDLKSQAAIDACFTIVLTK